MTGLDSEQKQRSSNYTGGEKAGQSWTDRVMGVKGTQDTPTQLPQDANEGVDDDEWVCSVVQIHSNGTVLFPHAG